MSGRDEADRLARVATAVDAPARRHVEPPQAPPREADSHDLRAAGAASPAPHELDALIHEAELAIVRRNRRLAGSMRQLEHRLAATAVQGVAVTAVAGVLALGVHAWWSRREPPPPRRWTDRWRTPREVPGAPGEPLASKGATAAATLGVAALLSAVPWHRVMPMVWPRLPASVRRHMSGETAGLWASIVVPMLLRSRRGRRR